MDNPVKREEDKGAFSNTLAFISCRSKLTKVSLSLPHPYFQSPPLAAPVNTLVSLLLQLNKVIVLAEKSFIFSPGSLRHEDVYRYMNPQMT